MATTAGGCERDTDMGLTFMTHADSDKPGAQKRRRDLRLQQRAADLRAPDAGLRNVDLKETFWRALFLEETLGIPKHITEKFLAHQSMFRVTPDQVYRNEAERAGISSRVAPAFGAGQLFLGGPGTLNLDGILDSASVLAAKEALLRM